MHLAGSATVGELAEITGLTRRMTGVIDRLVQAGYVMRDTDPDDRRRVIVRPVAEQDRVVGELFEPMQRAVEELYQRYSDDELAVLLDVNERPYRSCRRRRPACASRRSPRPRMPPSTRHPWEPGRRPTRVLRGAANVTVRAAPRWTCCTGPRWSATAFPSAPRTAPSPWRTSGTRSGGTRRSGRDRAEPVHPVEHGGAGGAGALSCRSARPTAAEIELTGGLSHAELTLPVPATEVE